MLQDKEDVQFIHGGRWQHFNTVCALRLALVWLMGGTHLAAAACSLTQLWQGQVSAWQEHRVLKRKRKSKPFLHPTQIYWW